MNVQCTSLEEQDGYVVGFQRCSPVSDIHPYPVEKVITVRLYHELAVRVRNLAEQAAQRSLSTRVKMDFRLLQKKHGRCVLAQQFRDHGQYLADAVAHIDQVAWRSFQPVRELPDLHLKGFTVPFAQRPDGDLIEETGVQDVL